MGDRLGVTNTITGVGRIVSTASFGPLILLLIRGQSHRPVISYHPSPLGLAWISHTHVRVARAFGVVRWALAKTTCISTRPGIAKPSSIYRRPVPPPLTLQQSGIFVMCYFRYIRYAPLPTTHSTYSRPRRVNHPSRGSGTQGMKS